MKKPCLTCTRVKDPENCENKKCNEWRRWFICRWDRMRSVPRLQEEARIPEHAGVPLGGHYYAAPHETVRYLTQDPCKRCLCPKDLCQTPCRTRQAWDNAGQEVYR